RNAISAVSSPRSSIQSCLSSFLIGVTQIYSVSRVHKRQCQSLTDILQLECQRVRSALVLMFQAVGAGFMAAKPRAGEKISTLSVARFSILLRGSVCHFVSAADRFDGSEDLAEFDLGLKFQWQSAAVVTNPHN